MSDVITKRCDNCDKARDKDTNHWSSVVGGKAGNSTVAWTGPLGVKPGELVLMSNNPLANVSHAYPEFADACGDECRFALLARYLATGTFARKPAGVIPQGMKQG